MAVKPIPDGYHTVTPYLMVPDVPRMIDFLIAAFGARETERHTRPDGSVGHAEVRIGNSAVMMGGAMEGFPAMPCMLYLYLPDVDAAYANALKAGGASLEEPAVVFYGDRRAGVRDEFGNLWYMATHVEDVPHEEIRRRAQAAMEKS